jgi:hypothetical protein
VVVRSNAMIVLVFADSEAALVGIGMDGAERWRRQIEEPVFVTDHLPAVSAETVALPIDGSLRGVELLTGHERWSSPIDGAPDDMTIRSDPAGVAVFCVPDRGALAVGVVDLDDGSPRWDRLLEPGRDGVMGASAIVGYANDVVVISTADLAGGGCEPRMGAFGEVSAYSLLDGSELWSVPGDQGATLFPSGLLVSPWTDASGVGVEPSILARSSDNWTVYDAVTGGVAASGTVEAGFGVGVHGPFVVASDASTVVGAAGSVEMGEIISIAGWSNDQLYVWAGDGVLSAVR